MRPTPVQILAIVIPLLLAVPASAKKSVVVVQPKSVPTIAVGFPRTGASFDVVETRPGKNRGSLRLVSPKGTAISLTNTKIEVTDGDIELGKVTYTHDGIRIEIKRRSKKASTIRITPVFIVLIGFSGPLTLRTNKSGQRVTVANVPAPVLALLKSLFPKFVTPGSARKVTPIVVSEGVAGQIDKPISLVSPKGTAISLTNTTVKVPKGDIKLGQPILVGKNTILIPVLQSSTQPSKIEVQLALDISKDAGPLIWVLTPYTPKWLLVALNLGAFDDDDDDDDDQDDDDDDQDDDEDDQDDDDDDRDG